MKYKIACNDGRTFFFCSDGSKVVPMEITNWPLESVADFARIFNLR